MRFFVYGLVHRDSTEDILLKIFSGVCLMLSGSRNTFIRLIWGYNIFLILTHVTYSGLECGSFTSFVLSRNMLRWIGGASEL